MKKPYQTTPDGKFNDDPLKFVEVLYGEVKNTLHSEAWKAAKKAAPYDRDAQDFFHSEFFSISCIAFMEAVKKWHDKRMNDPEYVCSVQFNTYITSAVAYAIFNYWISTLCHGRNVAEDAYYDKNDRVALEEMSRLKMQINSIRKSIEADDECAGSAKLTSLVDELSAMQKVFYQKKRQSAADVYADHIENSGQGSPITLSPEDRLSFKDILRNLGDDAAEVVATVLNAPADLVTYSVLEISTFFQKRKKWKRRRVLCAINQIRRALQE